MARYKYKLTDKTFVNPYHFIPLEEECNKNINYIKHREKTELKTGWIDCELKTLTPIFIPNTTNDDFFNESFKDEDNKSKKISSYDFFSYQDNKLINKQTKNPVIPGSSIRGTIRSAFEALTNSCMSTTDDNHILYKRVTSPAKPGRLINKNKEWKIVECKKYMLKTKDCRKDPSKQHNIEDYNDKDIIYFKSGNNYKGAHYMPKVVSSISKTKTNDCTIKGCLHKGEPFGRKHHESIFVEQTNSFEVSENSVKNLLENYKLFQDEKINLHKKRKEHSGYNSNIKVKKNTDNSNGSIINDLNGALIYYAEHNNKYYLSPAAIGREVFHNRLKVIIDTYSPCSTHEKLCQACAVFGFAGNVSNKEDDIKKNAIASRVRFSDAKTKKSKFLKPVILPELAGPKESSTELYMKKPNDNNIAMWNYDYAECKKDKKKCELKDCSPEIQGRKFYWHQENMKTFEEENKNRNFSKKIPYSDRLVKVRPVDKDVDFKFKVHFNQLTKEELDKLLWTLSIGNNKDLAHKIGMGKPIGLGSINIKIQEVIERKLNIEDNKFSYKEEKYTEDISQAEDISQVELGCSDKTKKVFEKISDFKNKPNNVHYPYCVYEKGKTIPENYEWFVGNKQIEGIGKGIDHVISENLSQILPNNEIPTLKIIEKLPKVIKPKEKIIEKDKIDEKQKLIQSLKSVSTKNVVRDLKKLKDNKLSNDDYSLIKKWLKKRGDSSNLTNPIVREYWDFYNNFKQN